MSDDLKLDNQLCFPLYALSRQVTTLYRPHLEKLGLTYPQYLVMMVLWEHHSVTVKLLGELLCLDSGTLTPLLKRMEAAGLLVRKRSSNDERMVDVTITGKGKEMEAQAESIPLNIKIGLDMTDEQIVKLRDQLKKILTKTIEDK
ncbi:DNA-binding MarR family transcriptional regulator [Dysgonomonas hofstadii]|uniref:DNA-binding MarR family transcriptional regulator n=1 Tax=Dysgonomonas hofstadii TaxID=637886 RepID=A0A840CNK1_9BACT|nr:MarR family transcriptional regulator [Dysgonomonas hofstadii]MBB4036976.1 DNA-binding MarR family transcriptional regulator [Dysgonomonas hofstadii]